MEYHEKIDEVFDRLSNAMSDLTSAEKVFNETDRKLSIASHEKKAERNADGRYQFASQMALCFGEYNELWLAQEELLDKRGEYYMADIEKDRLMAHIKILERKEI
jgi:hypothetical protein